MFNIFFSSVAAGSPFLLVISLEPVHIKTASKIMASITTERKMELRLS
jgi:hypothetical protein